MENTNCYRKKPWWEWSKPLRSRGSLIIFWRSFEFDRVRQLISWHFRYGIKRRRGHLRKIKINILKNIL